MKFLTRCLFLSLVCISLFASCNKDDEMMDDPTAQVNQNSPNKRTCGTHEHMEALLLDPMFKAAYKERINRFETLAASATERVLCGNPVVLPVAVHFQGVNNPNVACLRALAQAQVDILNNDYQGTNSDISTWINTASSSFPGLNYGETCIEFCIADQNHPSGYGLSNGDPAVTINTTTGDSDANWSGYLNIFVQPNTGVLGYSPLGGSGNGDGVVIDASAFGSGSGCGSVNPQSPYDLGRTLTHELGHYLLLDHIWGNGCGSDDGVGDTPNSRDPYYGCPNIGASSCSSTDLHMNYMDYTNDACMYMFSAGQSTRMENYVTSSLQNLVNNASNVCGGTSGPTCTDGIQNGDETGVDCGGSCPPCDGPTCTDGIQNGDETGVDCGGSCPPCGGNGPDVRVRSITKPASELCVPSFKPIVTIKNQSNQAVSSVKITYGIVGGVTKVKNWTGNIGPNKQKRITLPKINVGLGNKTFYAETSLPNGQADSNPSNDRKEKDIAVDGNQLVKVIIKPDDYGSEVTWEITDDNNNVVVSGGPFPDFNRRKRQRNICLTEGCYTFTIYDSYGDGICCDYGPGFYKLRDADNAIIAESDGQYGFSEEQTICITYDEYTYEGSRRDEKINPTVDSYGNIVEINNAGKGSTIEVIDENGVRIDNIKVEDVNSEYRIDKSKYAGKNVQVKLQAKPGKKVLSK